MATPVVLSPPDSVEPDTRQTFSKSMLAICIGMVMFAVLTLVATL